MTPTCQGPDCTTPTKPFASYCSRQCAALDGCELGEAAPGPRCDGCDEVTCICDAAICDDCQEWTRDPRDCASGNNCQATTCEACRDQRGWCAACVAEEAKLPGYLAAEQARRVA